MTDKNPIEILAHWADTQADSIFLRQPINSVDWKDFTWKTVYETVQNIASSLQALNYEPGSRIAIISDNSAHWVMCDLGIILAGMVSVPLYTQQNSDAMRYILDHCDAKAIFVGDIGLSKYQMIKTLKTISSIKMPYSNEKDYDLSWDDFISNQQSVHLNSSLNPEALATIVYTSGTTGQPKGVMHSVKNLSFAGTNFVNAREFTHHDTFFSYLPLSHIAERIFVEMICLYCGGMISFNQSLSSFSARLKQTSPTFFLGVPRIWSKIQEGILAKLPNEKHQLIFEKSEEAEYLKKLIRDNLGFDKIRLPASGAAPIAPELINWFHHLGIAITEGYAQTENCAYCTLNPISDNHVGTVGPALPQTEIQIADNQEILTKSPGTMQGYYLQPEETKKTMTDDGFLRTGDMGKLDENGYLTLTGRIKELFKTSKGKYIAPAPIENQIASNPIIGQICIIGSGLIQPIALITLSAIANSQSKENIETQLKELLSIVNSSLDKHEKIASIAICDEAWSIEKNLLTPTQKIKRQTVENHYTQFIQKVAAQKNTVYWESELTYE